MSSLPRNSSHVASLVFDATKYCEVMRCARHSFTNSMPLLRTEINDSKKLMLLKIETMKTFYTSHIHQVDIHGPPSPIGARWSTADAYKDCMGVQQHLTALATDCQKKICPHSSHCPVDYATQHYCF